LLLLLSLFLNGVVGSRAVLLVLVFFPRVWCDVCGRLTIMKDRKEDVPATTLLVVLVSPSVVVVVLVVAVP